MCAVLRLVVRSVVDWCVEGLAVSGRSRSQRSIGVKSQVCTAEPLDWGWPGITTLSRDIPRSSEENIHAVWRHFMPLAALCWCKLIQLTISDGCLQTRSSSRHKPSFYNLP